MEYSPSGMMYFIIEKNVFSFFFLKYYILAPVAKLMWFCLVITYMHDGQTGWTGYETGRKGHPQKIQFFPWQPEMCIEKRELHVDDGNKKKNLLPADRWSPPCTPPLVTLFTCRDVIAQRKEKMNNWGMKKNYIFPPFITRTCFKLIDLNLEKGGTQVIQQSSWLRKTDCR